MHRSAGCRKLEAGSWEPEAGSWQLEAVSWQLALLTSAVIIAASAALIYFPGPIAFAVEAIAIAARGESLALHRDGRGAPPTRRDDREYDLYVSEEERRRRGCIVRRMQPDFHHGLIGMMIVKFRKNPLEHRRRMVREFRLELVFGAFVCGGLFSMAALGTVLPDQLRRPLGLFWCGAAFVLLGVLALRIIRTVVMAVNRS